jgi:hypothetical protein
MLWIVYDRASLKSSGMVLFSKCRISSFKQEEAGSESGLQFHKFGKIYEENSSLISFVDDVHRKSRVPIGAPCKSMITVLLVNG